MKVNFFEKELIKVRERFNQTFGKQTVCDLQTRAQVIIAIIHTRQLQIPWVLFQSKKRNRCGNT